MPLVQAKDLKVSCKGVWGQVEAVTLSDDIDYMCGPHTLTMAEADETIYKIIGVFVWKYL